MRFGSGEAWVRLAASALLTGLCLGAAACGSSSFVDNGDASVSGTPPLDLPPPKQDASAAPVTDAAAEAAPDSSTTSQTDAAADGSQVAEGGSCTATCTNAHGTTSCTGALCSPTCATGYADCDGNPANGCETSLDAATSCGACGVSCANAHGTTACPAGVCVPTCATGFGDCDGNPANGCETATGSSVANCGSCGHACSTASGTPNCVNGVCGASNCPSGFGDCAGNGSCSTALDTTTDCGGCGVACALPNAVSSCSTGTCKLVSCNTGFADCDGNASNGCETQLGTVTSCSACGKACANTNGTTACTSGACVPACSSGFGDCDGNPANGCETSTKTSVQSCGACGHACMSDAGTPNCVNGVCGTTSCPSGFGNCSGTGCTTPLNTLTDCGACGVACSFASAAASCSTGTCKLGACNAGWANCDAVASNGCEASLDTVTNCGACGTTCTNANGTTACPSGTCVPTCASGFADCDGNPNNGCETDTQTNVLHCGSCPNACAVDGGTPNCVAGVCGIASCPAGFGNCDGNPANGCEAPLTTNTNCGACGVACSLANATSSCSTGTCQLGTCNSGFADCDHTASSGCEASLHTTSSCGACGTTCTNANGSTACPSGTCAPTCASNFGDCDGNPNNGCETSTAADPNNCGTCANVCTASTPACSGGTCGCDTSGAWGAKVSVSVSWSSTTVLAAGSGTVHLWGLFQGTQSGTSIPGTLLPCNVVTPDFKASSLAGGETYGISFPTTLFDQSPSYLPAVSETITLGGLTPGSTYTTPATASLLGLSMTTPTTDPWPSASSGVTQVDMDQDTKPGVTAQVKSGGSYSYIPLDIFKTSRADLLYMALRSVVSLSGTLTSCTQASGTANFTHVENHILGCRVHGGGDCSGSQASFADGNRPIFTLGAGTFTTVKLTGAATCANVVQTVP